MAAMWQGGGMVAMWQGSGPTAGPGRDRERQNSAAHPSRHLGPLQTCPKAPASLLSRPPERAQCHPIRRMAVVPDSG